MSLKTKYRLSRIDDTVYKYRFIILAALAIIAVFLSVGHVFANDVWKASGNITDNLVSNLTTLYTDKLFVFLLILNCRGLAFIKDEKWTARLIKSLIIICVVFVVCKGYDVITNTLLNLSDTAVGGGGAATGG